MANSKLKSEMKVRKPLEVEEKVEQVENPMKKLTDAELIAMYHKAVNKKQADMLYGPMAAYELIDVRGYTIIEHEFKKDEFVKKVA